jgi:hypothetical protein
LSGLWLVAVTRLRLAYIRTLVGRPKDRILLVADYNQFRHPVQCYAATPCNKMLPLSATLWCAVKGTDPQREINPPGNWFVPPGSNRSNGGGNEVVGAFGVEGRDTDSASMQAVM